MTKPRTRRRTFCTIAALFLSIAYAACSSHKARIPANPNPASIDGCWVDVFDADDFNGDKAHDRIAGPGEWSTLRDLPGAAKVDWANKIDSLIVGPHARLHVWKDEGFESTHWEFGPKTQVASLEKYNAGNQIESMKLEYVP
ncbi:MAG: hypothetical protein HYR85_01325 [Planctomycetes bacterium]|nr:hypothetical protein [Planctomycetota bacterium]MBI3843143.1 hypothetical protein [Planctomycetota bacterium]